MKLLLDETVYEVPTELIMSWVNMTPKFRDDFRGTWEQYRKQRLGTEKPTAAEFATLLDDFLRDKHEWYYQLMFDAAMDMREAMKEDFEDYKSDMTPEEVMEYAERPTTSSHQPVLKQPIKIPINSSD